jgi:transposase
MKLQLDSPNIYLANEPVDFRKGIDGLSEYIIEEYTSSVIKGLYVFHNKSKDKLKLLFWHGNGFCLLQKRLERNRFTIPIGREQLVISNKQLSWLLAGLDWQTMSNWKELSYEDYY